MSGRWGPLYFRLTAVVLGTLSLFGVAVIVLHGLALGRATVSVRLETLRLLADIAAREPRGQPPAIPSQFDVALVGAGGELLSGRPLPPWMRRDLARTPPGEYCILLGPCYGLRSVPLDGGTGTLVVYYRPARMLLAPLSVALLLSVLLWLVVSAGAGLVLLSSLRRADESRRQLLAGLAHDLGTPLTSIRGFAETLLREPEADPGQRRGWTVVYREALRMQRLVEDMLALSRLEAGKLTLVPRPFDLRDALHEAAERARLAYGASPALEVPETEATVTADRDRIDQVVANLVDNAYRYAEGKDVRLSLAPTAVGWRLTVRDGGPGLSPRARERLFEPFHRGDSGGGSGLGLAIARQIVERHGGRIGVEDGPGGGCRVVVEIPSAPARV